MNHMKVFAAVTAASVALSSMFLLVRGTDNTYDPQNDPLISLSYLNGVFAPTYDKKISDAEKRIEENESVIAALTAENAAQNSKIAVLETELANVVHGNETSAGMSYEVICLRSGEKLLAKSPLEIILRSGTAITVSITSNGINDLTAGSELLNADAVPLYHQLLVPRGNDGRGIQVTSEEAYIMVRGAYEIIK